MSSKMFHQPTALLSVYDKAGIVTFAKQLQTLGFQLISSGGTARVLEQAGLTVTDVSEITGLMPILDHRVVTLTPQIHGGLLALPTTDHRRQLDQMGAPWIDLVCCDLYPLEEEIALTSATQSSVIEQTDIGGPTMLRSAAKGRRIVICDPGDRERVITWLAQGRPEEDAFVTRLCAKAEAHVSAYCLASARFHGKGTYEGFVGTHVATLRYGENPFQSATAFRTDDHPLGFRHFEQRGGTDPSFINLTDLDRLTRTMVSIVVAGQENSQDWSHVAIAVKHGNPCGVGVGTDAKTAIARMIDGDHQSIHGAFVMTNFRLSEGDATLLREYGMPPSKRRMFDGVVAPAFDDGVTGILDRKTEKCRMLCNPLLADIARTHLVRTHIRMTIGGFLRQEGEPFILNLSDERLVRRGSLTSAQEGDLLLAWAIGSTSVSNTVTLVKNRMLIGNGVGQQSRVRASKLALEIAHECGHDVNDALAYSDSFFPFPDGIEVLGEAGIAGVFASSGSENDERVRSTADVHGIIFYQLPDKVCRGFYGH